MEKPVEKPENQPYIVTHSTIVQLLCRPDRQQKKTPGEAFLRYAPRPIRRAMRRLCTVFAVVMHNSSGRDARFSAEYSPKIELLRFAENNYFFKCF